MYIKSHKFQVHITSPSLYNIARWPSKLTASGKCLKNRRKMLFVVTWLRYLRFQQINYDQLLEYNIIKEYLSKIQKLLLFLIYLIPYKTFVTLSIVLLPQQSANGSEITTWSRFLPVNLRVALVVWRLCSELQKLYWIQ